MGGGGGGAKGVHAIVRLLGGHLQDYLFFWGGGGGTNIAKGIRQYAPGKKIDFLHHSRLIVAQNYSLTLKRLSSVLYSNLPLQQK